MWFLKISKPCGCWRILASDPLDYEALQPTINAIRGTLRPGEFVDQPVPATKLLRQACRAKMQAVAYAIAHEGKLPEDYTAAPPVAGGGCGGKCGCPSVTFPLPAPSVPKSEKPSWWAKMFDKLLGKKGGAA